MWRAGQLHRGRVELRQLHRQQQRGLLWLQGHQGRAGMQEWQHFPQQQYNEIWQAGQLEGAVGEQQQRGCQQQGPLQPWSGHHLRLSA